MVRPSHDEKVWLTKKHEAVKHMHTHSRQELKDDEAYLDSIQLNAVRTHSGW